MAELHQPELVDPASLQSYLAAIVESSDDAIIGKSLDGTITKGPSESTAIPRRR